MSASSCNSVRERAPDVALGVLTGPERADVLTHLDQCPSCQTLVGEYSFVADALLELVPDVEPAAPLAPPVLEAMRPPHRHRVRRRVAALAAAAVVVFGVGTGLTVALVSAGGGDGSSSAAPAIRSAPMVGSGDLTVGRVVTTGDRPPTLAVSVDYWVPDGSYQVLARDRAGGAAPVGTVQVTDGRGTWTGSTSTVDQPVAVMLLDQSGHVVCEGQFS